jgi:CRISPR system Cascade subunit CasD
MANTLFLRLEGPLQSWGERARWSVRDTASEPTKSAVVGLLGCALGLSSDNELRELSRSLRMGVRCDKPGSRLTDYQTVGGGYDYPVLLTAEGKPKISSGRPHTEQTWRQYLCDASFLIALQAAPDVIARLAGAIQSPHWSIYLGRKSCPPSRPPYAGIGDFPDLVSALAGWENDPAPEDTAKVKDAASTTVRAVIECEPSKGVRRRDEIESRSRRTFAPRYVSEKPLTLFAREEESPCTSPD